jgi:P27 family predicted phage terminase small subunit
MAGRKPRVRKPLALAKLHGPTRGRPITTDGPEGVGELWAAPDWMNDDQRAQWRYAVLTSPPGLLTETDRECLITWCIAAVYHAKAAQEVDRAGLIVKTKDGNLIQNPYLPIVNKQAMIMLRAGSEMGFSPSSRASIGATRGAPVPAAGAGRGSKLTAYIEGNPDAVH